MPATHGRPPPLYLASYCRLCLRRSAHARHDGDRDARLTEVCSPAAPHPTGVWDRMVHSSMWLAPGVPLPRDLQSLDARRSAVGTVVLWPQAPFLHFEGLRGGWHCSKAEKRKLAIQKLARLFGTNQGSAKDRQAAERRVLQARCRRHAFPERKAHVLSQVP